MSARGFRNSQTGDDGLTRSKRIRLYSKAVKMRFELTTENRKEMVYECLDVMKDPVSHPMVRMKAAQILVAMEAMNQKDEHAAEGIGEGRAEPTIVYVLPANGTESIERIEVK